LPDFPVIAFRAKHLGLAVFRDGLLHGKLLVALLTLIFVCWHDDSSFWQKYECIASIISRMHCFSSGPYHLLRVIFSVDPANNYIREIGMTTDILMFGSSSNAQAAYLLKYLE
jgi:hypothetical protein